LVDEFDETGVVLKGGKVPQSDTEPADDTVDNMASRAATKALS
tara:strand:- start:1639 stop:1767 length:129 start_codon:yes stop_codon:yes gene_type:complete